MKDLLPLRGIVTVLNTPFTEDDRLDTEALRHHVRRALEVGVAGFLAPAMASEANKLTTAERELFVDTLLDEVRGRAVVIGGASAASSIGRIETAKRLVSAGCDGVLVSIPYENDEQYEHAVREVAGTAPPFLMLQDWDPTGYGVPVKTLVKLFETVETVRAVKVEVVPAGRKYTELLEATDGRLHLSGGWAVMQMIEALDRGVHAFMPTALHAIYVHIYTFYRKGHRDEALKLFNEILPVLAFSNQHLDISIHFFKRLLHAQGIYSTANVRPPILPFDRVHTEIAEELIAVALALETKVGEADD